MAPGRSSPLEDLQGAAGSLPNGEPVLAAVDALGGLDDPLREAAPADHDPQRAAEQLRVGELLPRAGVPIVVKDLRAEPLAQRLVDLVRGPRSGSSALASETRWTRQGAIEAGQTIPRSSAPCSIAAATIRAGPIP
jgi:hypothetical protein